MSKEVISPFIIHPLEAIGIVLFLSFFASLLACSDLGDFGITRSDNVDTSLRAENSYLKERLKVYEKIPKTDY